MARIAGVNIPNQKRVPIGLTYIHGIGRTKAHEICSKVGIPMDRRVHEMTDDEVLRVRELIDREYMVELLIVLGEHCIERLGLRHGARKAVENKPPLSSMGGGIRGGDPIGDHLDDDVVRNELARLHDRLDLLAERAARRDRPAQHVAGGELNQPVLLFEALCLRALACAGGSEQDQVHQRRPRSRAFLISPSY